MLSLICVWINGWVNNREAGDLRCHHGHYDVNVMALFGDTLHHFIFLCYICNAENIINNHRGEPFIIDDCCKLFIKNTKAWLSIAAMTPPDRTLMRVMVKATYAFSMCPLIWLWIFNSQWLGGDIWWHTSGWTVAQVTAYCLTAPSHCPNQCWRIISKILCYSPESNFTQTLLFIIANLRIIKITATSPRGQWLELFLHQSHSLAARVYQLIYLHKYDWLQPARWQSIMMTS